MMYTAITVGLTITSAVYEHSWTRDNGTRTVFVWTLFSFSYLSFFNAADWTVGASHGAGCPSVVDHALYMLFLQHRTRSHVHPHKNADIFFWLRGEIYVGRCNSPLTQVTDVGVAVRVIDSSARRLHAIASWVGTCSFVHPPN